MLGVVSRNRNCCLGGDGSCTWTQLVSLLVLLAEGTVRIICIFHWELELDKVFFSSSSMGAQIFPKN
jgi:hypothetical protein